MIRISLFLLTALLALAACPRDKDEHDHAKGAHDHDRDAHGHTVDEHGHGKGEHENDAKTPAPTAASLSVDGGTR